MPKSSCQLCQRQPGALGAIPNAASSGCDSECTRRQTPKQMVFENKLLRLMLVLRFLTHKGHVIKVPKEALAVAHSHSLARQILNSHVVGQIVRVIKSDILSWNLLMCSMSCAVLQFWQQVCHVHCLYARGLDAGFWRIASGHIGRMWL